jgi:hypothetical protein
MTRSRLFFLCLIVAASFVSSSSVSTQQPSRTAAKSESRDAENKRDTDARVLEQELQDLERYVHDTLEASKAAADHSAVMANNVIVYMTVIVAVLLGIMAAAGAATFLQINKDRAELAKLRDDMTKDFKEMQDEHSKKWDLARSTDLGQQVQLQKIELLMKPYAQIEDYVNKELGQLRREYERPTNLKAWTLTRILELQGAGPETTSKVAVEIRQLLDAEIPTNISPAVESSPSKTTRASSPTTAKADATPESKENPTENL